MTRVLFVCLGNICRSPTAQGVFEKLLADNGLAGRVEVDSAGTHAYHQGEPPDERAQMEAARRGVDLSGQRARAVTEQDFERFDYILAMDGSNLSILQSRCPPQFRQRVRLFLEFAGDLDETDVPDPYYGGQHGFERVLDLVEAGARGLLADIERNAGK